MKRYHLLIEWKTLYYQSAQLTGKLKLIGITIDLNSQTILSKRNRMERIKLHHLHHQSKQYTNTTIKTYTDTDQWKRSEKPDTLSQYIVT